MPTTTTTTTLPITLSTTGTIQYESHGGVQSVTPKSGSLSFGTIAPGGTSKTIIVSLTTPLSISSQNIKIGLIDAGGISFTNTTFGITSSQERNEDIIPTTYFQGINTEAIETSPYNIAIENRAPTFSQYVYLNITLPRNFTFTTGILKYKWFYDYVD